MTGLVLLAAVMLLIISLSILHRAIKTAGVNEYREAIYAQCLRENETKPYNEVKQLCESRVSINTKGGK